MLRVLRRVPVFTLVPRPSRGSQGHSGAGLVRESPGIDRPRHPERTAFYRQIEAHFEEFAAVHEERFEAEDGPRRPVVRRVAEAFLDCGRPKNGFARVRCPGCGGEFFVAFSCQTRNVCPSCQAKRAELLAEKLREEVLAPASSVATRTERSRSRFRGVGGLAAKTSRASWARLLRRVFAIDLVCPRCGTELAVVSVITEPETIDLLLAHAREEEVDLLFDAGPKMVVKNVPRLRELGWPRSRARWQSAAAKSGDRDALHRPRDRPRDHRLRPRRLSPRVDSGSPGPELARRAGGRSDRSGIPARHRCPSRGARRCASTDGAVDGRHVLRDGRSSGPGGIRLPRLRREDPLRPQWRPRSQPAPGRCDDPGLPAQPDGDQ